MTKQGGRQAASGEVLGVGVSVVYLGGCVLVQMPNMQAERGEALVCNYKIV